MVELSLTDIDDWLTEAADTARRLPPVGPRAYKSCMPDTLREAREVWERALERGRYDDMVVRPGPPNAKAIDRFDEVMTWFAFLNPEETKLVWARANGMKWVLLAKVSRYSRRECGRIWQRAILKIWVGIRNREKSLPICPEKRIVVG